MDNLDRAQDMVRRYTGLLDVMRLATSPTARASAEQSLWHLVEQANAWLYVLREDEQANEDAIHVVQPLAQFWDLAHEDEHSQTWGVQMPSVDQLRYRAMEGARS